MKTGVTTIMAMVFSACLADTVHQSDTSEMALQDTQIVHVVEIKNLSFVPKSIKAARGDKIVWINKDMFPHNIVDSGSQVTLSETLAKDDKFSYIVDKDMNYKCGFHPSMTGTINVSSQQQD